MTLTGAIHTIFPEPEQWLPIKGFEGVYSISDYGRVKSHERKVYDKSGNVHYTQKEIVLKGAINKGGYFAVSLYKEGKKKMCRINVLVATHFIPNPNNLPVANHEDGNKLNNHKSNLSWVTHSENAYHAFRTGLKKPVVNSLGRKGGKAFAAKAISQFTKGGKLVRHFGAAIEAEQFGFDRFQISKCLRGQLGSHGKYIWKYKNKKTK